MARVKATAKNRIPLSGTIAKATPASASPSAAERFMMFTAARKPKIVIAVANDTPIIPIVRCRAIRPDAASQVWKAKYSVHAKNSTP